jgi:hypothetical protein
LKQKEVEKRSSWNVRIQVKQTGDGDYEVDGVKIVIEVFQRSYFTVVI